MDNLKKIGKKALFVYDTVLPVVCFTVIFLTFMLNIISRYVLSKALPWNYEISVLGYMWCMYFGVGHAMGSEDHVVFSLVYDMLPAKVQYIMDYISNIFLFILLAVAYVPCWQAMFASSMRTGVLKIPYAVAFAPFMLMYTEIMLRTIYNVYRVHKRHKEGLAPKQETVADQLKQEGGAVE